MVAIRKLTVDEAARAFPGRRQPDLAEYLVALRQVEPGESAEVVLDGLSSRALKRRFGQAAAQLGVRLRWARAASPTGLYFQVTPQPTASRPGPRQSTTVARHTRRGTRNTAGTAEVGGAPVAYCMKCRAPREMRNPRPITMKNGRPATEGECPVCGTRLFKIGKAG